MRVYPKVAGLSR